MESPFLAQKRLLQPRTSTLLVINTLSTWARLIGAFLITLFLLPYLFHPERLGVVGVGLWMLLLSSAGIMSLLQETVRSTMLRELSVAWESGDSSVMSARYSAATVAVGLLALGIALTMLAVTPLALRLFEFPPEMRHGMLGAWLILAGRVIIAVTAGPSMALLDISRRVPLGNLVFLCNRLSSLVAALVVFEFTELGRTNPLLTFIAAETIGAAAVRVLGAVLGRWSVPDARVRLRGVRGSDIRTIFHTGRYVVQQAVAINLFDRTNQILINIFIGPAMNAAFGTAILLVGYTRQIANAFSHGIEPLAASRGAGSGVRGQGSGVEGRGSGETPGPLPSTIPSSLTPGSEPLTPASSPSPSHPLTPSSSPTPDGIPTRPPTPGPDAVGRLILTLLRIQAGVVIPIVVAIMVMGRVLIDLWLGKRTEVDLGPDANAAIANMLIILMLGSPFFVIVQGGLRIMLGAGDVDRYAPVLLRAGLAQAALATLILALAPTVALWMGLSIREAAFIGVYAVCAGMSAANLVMYGLYIPLLACRLYSIPRREMYLGAMGPGFMVGLCVGASLVAARLALPAERWTAAPTLLVLLGAAILAAGLSWIVVLRSGERARLTEMLRSGVRGGRPRE